MDVKLATPEAVKLFHDGAIALSIVESAGFRVDTEYLNRTIEQTDQQIKQLESDLRKDETFQVWRRRFRDRTNLGSRDQLGKVVFDVLKYERKQDVSNNDEAAFDHIDLPFVRDYMHLEKIKRANGTFLKGIYREVVDGYLYPNYNLNIPTTFRSSADNPNSQNWPIRNKEISELIRRCFIARDGHVLVEIDFSGIEVRVAACYNHDPNLISYIKDPSKDMHRDMAAQVYKVPVEQVSKDARYCAKNKFVFPQFYGSFYVDCAKHLWSAIDSMKLQTVAGEDIKELLAGKGITALGECDYKQPAIQGTFEHHVKRVEEHFWNKRFAVYKAWKQKWYDLYLKRGWFEMKTGFVCSGIHKRNDVINYPVQGAAFHCLLWSLIRMVKWLTRHKMRSKIVGQIHDSIIADVHLDELDDFLAKASEVMTVDLPATWKWIIVPIEVEAEVAPEGGSWHDKRKVEL